MDGIQTIIMVGVKKMRLWYATLMLATFLLLLKKQWSDITLATKSGKVNNWLCDEK